MRGKTNLDKSEKDFAKEWKKQKAKEKAKEIAVSILCGAVNGLTLYGHLAASLYFSAPPMVLREEDLLPKKKHY